MFICGAVSFSSCSKDAYAVHLCVVLVMLFFLIVNNSMRNSACSFFFFFLLLTLIAWLLAVGKFSLLWRLRWLQGRPHSRSKSPWSCAVWDPSSEIFEQVTQCDNIWWKMFFTLCLVCWNLCYSVSIKGHLELAELWEVEPPILLSLVMRMVCTVRLVVLHFGAPSVPP